MTSEAAIQSDRAHRRLRNGVVFGVVVVVWLLLDIASKQAFASFQPGQVVAGPFLGIFQFQLVHNTGAAWGMFGDSTLALGLISIVVCIVLVVYLFILSPQASVVEAIGIGLVCAGGIGNAIDRLTLGYVVDFIEPVFIDFPVFNIADIGVTCGFIIFVIGMIVNMGKAESRKGHSSDEASGDRL